MNIIEAMKARRSVRTYDGQAITPEEFTALQQASESATSPFGGSVSIRLKSFDMAEGFRPSTYGYITGAVDFFLMGIAPTSESALSAGFRFEQVVLKAWQMGLGTCWIAATFDGTAFGQGQTWPAGEELKIVSPVGRPADPTAFEREIRDKVQASHRRPFGQLFFSDDFQQSLSEESRYGEALEMMRLAPSSTNSQPWRALVKGDQVDFYFAPLSPASVLDCGIGLCHFVETEKYYGRSGSFFKADAHSPAPDNWHYLVSYKG